MTPKAKRQQNLLKQGYWRGKASMLDPIADKEKFERCLDEEARYKAKLSNK